jgi:HK97 family phage portal protein
MADELGNVLGVYEPFTRAQLDALKSVPHPSGGGYAQTYSSWGAWDRDIRGGFDGSEIDYGRKVGNPAASSLVMAGIRWAGNTMPEPPVQVKRTTGKKGESEVVPNHPLAQLWRRPNPYYSGRTLMKGLASSWIVKSDAYVQKVWNDAGTRPAELWYMPHWLVRPRWVGDNLGAWLYGAERDDPTAFIAYYEYDDGRGRKYRLEVSDVIHFRDGINPETRCGENKLFSILREIYGDNEAANWFGALMANGGVPKFILAADPDLDLTPEKRKEVSDETQRASRGDNRGKVLTLSGVKPYKLPFSPEELDLRASRYMSEDRFCAITGIPAVELELGAGRESSIYNNVRQASERATERFLKPAWDHIAEELTVQLLPDFVDGEKSLLSVKGYDGWAIKTAGEELYVAHDLSKVSALQEDQDALHTRVGADYQNGIVMRSEARSALGYGSSDEANEDADRVFYEKGQAAPAQPPDEPAKAVEVAGASNGNGHK